MSQREVTQPCVGISKPLLLEIEIENLNEIPLDKRALLAGWRHRQKIVQELIDEIRRLRGWSY